jgi:adenylate kinase
MKQAQRSQEIDTIKGWLGTGSINIFGLPFAGKDTHAQELALRLDATVLGGGDILRNSVIPDHVKKTIDAGGLAPTDDYVRIVLPYLSRAEFAGKPLILSSVGRWRGEEPGVIAAAKASNHELKAVIFLHINHDTVLDRWQHSVRHQTRGAREDDAEHILEKRFAEFEAKTLPVIEYYRGLGLLIEVDGTPPVANVSQTILDELVAFSKK